jgi:hypothetical protein
MDALRDDRNQAKPALATRSMHIFVLEGQLPALLRPRRGGNIIELAEQIS